MTSTGAQAWLPARTRAGNPPPYRGLSKDETRGATASACNVALMSDTSVAARASGFATSATAEVVTASITMVASISFDFMQRAPQLGHVHRRT